MYATAICVVSFCVIACHGQSLSVVLDFEAAPNEQSLAAMTREFEVILKPSGLRIDFKTRRQAEQIESDNLVVLRFTGECVIKPASAVGSGTLGYSYVLDGRVQPFGEINCDRVIRVVSSALSASDYLRSDQLFGRALGRVLAHEVVHMLSDSIDHARDGLACKELSAKQLLAPALRLQARDFARLHINR